MMHWEELYRFKTKRFAVVLDCASEDNPDLSWADAEIMDKLDRGIYVCVVFRVRVLLDGLMVGYDTLGNSVYENLMDFRTEHVGARGAHGSYFRDMVSEAIGEARKTLGNVPRIRTAAP